MIKDLLSKAISDHLHAEFDSAYLYLSMSSESDRLGFKGAASWFLVQAKEEMAHAIHMYRYLLSRQVPIAYKAIGAPSASYGSLKELFEKTLAHEQRVSELINNIASLALKENDHASYNFIMWYVEEQVEEEANVEDILAKIRLAGDQPGMLYSLDAELAARTFENPFPGE